MLFHPPVVEGWFFASAPTHMEAYEIRNTALATFSQNETAGRVMMEITLLIESNCSSTSVGAQSCLYVSRAVAEQILWTSQFRWAVVSPADPIDKLSEPHTCGSGWQTVQFGVSICSGSCSQDFWAQHYYFFSAISCNQIFCWLESLVHE